MVFEKHTLVNYNKLQSLIKAEWSVVRTCQRLVEESWRTQHKLKKFPQSCCGILFKGNYAYASNGHFLLRVRTDGPSIDPSVRHFFYNYNDDAVYENFNPFQEHAGVSVEEMLSIIQQWKSYVCKVRVSDLIDAIEEKVSVVRHRREIGFHGGYDSGTNELLVRLAHKKGATTTTRIPVYSSPSEGFPEFVVNLSYLHKVIDIVSPFYHVIDLCFNGGFDETILIKAKNPYRKSPDIRFALGQFII